jgi:hypothetical protein
MRSIIGRFPSEYGDVTFFQPRDDGVIKACHSVIDRPRSEPPGDLPPSAVHNFALTIQGIHLLDRADFDAVGEAAAARNRWEFMLTIAPLRIPRGTGSPVNPIAMF